MRKYRVGIYEDNLLLVVLVVEALAGVVAEDIVGQMLPSHLKVKMIGVEE